LAARRFVDELRISVGAEDELWRHGVVPDEVLEVLWDDPAFFRDKVPNRSLMIGRTEGNRRLLTVVIEPTSATGVWDVVTGWASDKGETTAWKKARGGKT
jgi:hypothetical protein